MLFNDIQDDDEMMFDEMDSSDFIDAPSDSHEVPPANATAILFGHDQIERQLLAMLENKRFPHGLIFSGMEGIGKSVMAFRLARYLLSQGGKKDDTLNMFGDLPQQSTSLYVAPTDPNFARVASEGHPDLRIIRRTFDEEKMLFKNSIAVEDIRKIAPFMHQTVSQEDGWRIVIIDDADLMTRSSQNSLLKILEEPPEKSLLILIAHRAGALLPTIYSRCVHIPFMPLSDDIIRTAISGRCTADKIPTILSMSEGSLGAAYEYTEAHYADLITQTVGLLNDGQKLNWAAIQIFADFFGNKGNEDAQRIFRETMLWIASGLVRGKLAGFEHFKHFSTPKKIKIYDDLRSHFDRCTMGSLDKRFLIIGAYTIFE